MERGGGGGVKQKGRDTPTPTTPTSSLPPPPHPLRSHAGYSYCGHVMAHAYAAVTAAAPSTRRVVLLGPSHHAVTRAPHLSAAAAYATPLGDLVVDAGTVAALGAGGGGFASLDAGTDEAEHSLELHAPWLAHAFAGRLADVRLVPIMVGALDDAAEAAAAAALAPLLADPATLFVASTDFCHWGARFRYTECPPGAPSIADGVEAMDREGMALIEAGGGSAPFRSYLARTRNTICGRYPVSLLLATLAEVERARPSLRHATRFLAYDQSSRAATPADSSVSYASAATRLVVE